MAEAINAVLLKSYLLMYSGHKLLEPDRTNYTDAWNVSSSSAVLLDVEHADWLHTRINATNMTVAELYEEDDECGVVQHYTLIRFLLLQMASVVGLIGIVFNNVLLYVFIVKQRANLYQIALAALDTLLCLCYVSLFGVDAFSVYLKNEVAFRLWHFYGLGMFFVSRTVQMAIPHIMICATFERLVWIIDSKNKCLRAAVRDHWRYTITAGVFVYALAVRWPMLFAYQIKSYPLCNDTLRSQEVFPRPLFFTPLYRVYDIYVPMILQVCLPFVLLLTLNLTIIIKLHMTREKNNLRELMKKHATMGLVNESQLNEKIERNLAAKRAHKRKVRDAIYTMSVIVASYLLCNGMNVLMVVSEKFIRPAIFFTEKRGQTDLYVGITDVISFLYMFFSSTRLIVYFVCNPQSRQHLSALIPRSLRVSTLRQSTINKFTSSNQYWRSNRPRPSSRRTNQSVMSTTFAADSLEPTHLTNGHHEQTVPMLGSTNAKRNVNTLITNGHR